MRLKWPEVLLAVIVSGCGGDRSGQVPQMAPPLAFQVVTLPAPADGAPFSYAEPIIAIHPDGTALAVAATANSGAPPTLWLSRDAGASWTTGADFDGTGASTGDADVAIGRDGHLYALNLAFSATPPDQPTNPTIFVFNSADGVTWSGPAAFPPPQSLDQPDRPWLFVDPNDPARVFLVHSEGGGNVVLWRSVDHAATFEGPVPVTGGANGQAALALSSRPLFDPTDASRIFMLYETTAAGMPAGADANTGEFPLTQVWLAVSTDAGQSWSNQLVFDASDATGTSPPSGVLAHLLVASAISPAGNLFAAFSLRGSGSTETHIYLTHSTDHGATWSPPSQVDSVLPSNVMPTLAAGPDGVLFVAWYGSVSPDFRDAEATWGEMFAQTADALAARPLFMESRISGPDPVHVGGINTAGNPGFQLGQNWGLRDLQSLAVDGCGLPHPVWAVDHGGMLTRTGVPMARADSAIGRC